MLSLSEILFGVNAALTGILLGPGSYRAVSDIVVQLSSLYIYILIKVILNYVLLEDDIL